MVTNPAFRTNRLESKTFASGSTVQIQTQGQLPPGRRIQAILFRLDVDLVQPASGMAAQLGSVLHQLVAQIKIGRLVSITGLGLKFMDWMHTGHQLSAPAGFPATASATFSRSIVWVLRYADLTNPLHPNDGALPSEMLTDPIEVRFGTNAIFGATVPTISNGTLSTYVIHDAATLSNDEATVPQSINIQSDDASALTWVINKTGAWFYAFLYREASNDSGSITTTQVPTVTTYVDGEPIMNNVSGAALCSAFNDQRAAGSNFYVESQTAPVAGEAINDVPGVAAAAGQGVTMDFVPLLFPCQPYTTRKSVPVAQIGFKVEIQGGGTLSTYKIGYRIAELRPVNAIADTARRVGIPNATFAPHTDDNAVRGINAGISSMTLPAKIKAK